MELASYVDSLRRDLAVAAEAGGEEALALAERLVAPLESAARLVLLEALAAAAEEISCELAPGSVDVRLRGSDPDFVVTSPWPGDDVTGDTGGGAGAAGGPAVPPGAGTTSPSPSPGAEVPGAGDGRTARVTLRVPEHLKPRIDEAAARAGLSVNTWLVQALTTALDPAAVRPPRAEAPRGHRYRGWVR
ncbi:toxin-antitoxin system HicB family antitoxin [Parafrankia discariae]|uniref:toxin-antitoxin system HicB family antitoxin n=1 Tax=Parafrankia discariae TaxID=365528 RepID=UPI00036E5D0F|nr:toxin-antitoxin system HicB family antitoxin [Parafrankia discariae]